MLGLLLSPVGKIVGAAVLGAMALAAVWLYADNNGYQRAASECNTAALEQELSQMRRDLSQARLAEQAAERIADDEQKLAQSLRERIDAFKAANPGDAVCAPTDAERELMLDIIGPFAE